MTLGSRLMSRINIVKLSPHLRHCHSVFKYPFSLPEIRAHKPEVKISFMFMGILFSIPIPSTNNRNLVLRQLRANAG